MAQRHHRNVADDVMGGEPRIAGRRIAVRQSAERVGRGDLDAGAIGDRYDLDVADVCRARTPSHDNPAEMARIEREWSERYSRKTLSADRISETDIRILCDEHVPPQTVEYLD